MSILAGMPPRGVGIYARAQSVDFLARFDFVVLNGRRADSRAKGAILISGGKSVYLFSTPERWTPAAAVSELAFLETKAHSIGAVGIVANPERDWALPANQRAAMARILSTGLVQVAERGLRVGLVSIPQWPALGDLELDGKVWGSPENYAKGRPAGTFERRNARWREIFGEGRVINSVSGWVSHAEINTPEGFDVYLESLPRTLGAIAWTTNNDPAWMTQALLDWSPGGSIPEQFVQMAASFFSTAAGIVTAIVIGIVLLFVVVL